MMKQDMKIHTKSEDIKKIVEAVAEPNRAGQITTVDWWEDALTAVGFVKKDERQKVVYVDTDNVREGRFRYDCDIYHSDHPADHTTLYESDDASLEDTVKKIEEFLLDEDKNNSALKMVDGWYALIEKK